MMDRIAREIEGDELYRSILDAQRATPDRPAPMRSPTPPATSPTRSIWRRWCAGPRRARPLCGWRANGHGRRSWPCRRISRPGASWRWYGACITSSPRTRATRTTWSTAPAASPSRKASPSPASASSRSPACPSARGRDQHAAHRLCRRGTGGRLTPLSRKATRSQCVSCVSSLCRLYKNGAGGHLEFLCPVNMLRARKRETAQQGELR